MTTTKKSLNLSARYIPDWGNWEVLREIVCNGIDAVETPEITKLGPDMVNVFTETVPKLSELRIIGAGSKDASTSDIGQFGEGFKMAAMACIRQGGRLEATSPDWSVTFGFEEDDGEEVLHCYIDESPQKIPGGFNVSINMLGVGILSDERFIDRKECRIDKGSISVLTVYVKGVWIAQLASQKSIWNWNLNTLALNRDRNLVNNWAVEIAIGRHLAQRDDLDHQFFEQIFSNDHCIEHDAVVTRASLYNVSKHGDAVKEAVKNLWGDKAVVPSKKSQRVNQIAVARGYTLITGDSMLHHFLESMGCETADQVMPKTAPRKEIPMESAWVPRIQQTRALMAIANISPLIVPFEWRETVDNNGQHIAITSSQSGQVRLWLHRNMLEGESDIDYFTSIIHALAVTNTPALRNDSISIELSTARIGAELAVRQFCGKNSDTEEELLLK